MKRSFTSGEFPPDTGLIDHEFIDRLTGQAHCTQQLRQHIQFTQSWTFCKTFWSNCPFVLTHTPTIVPSRVHVNGASREMEEQLMPVKNVVLVHGAWGDGSHWRNVIPLLADAGLNVTAAQNPLTSLDDDIHKTRTLLDQQDGPTVLVGHSYGGAVITGAGNHPHVVGLVYIAAFAPDEGDAVGALLTRGGHEVPEGLLAPDGDGFLWLNFDAFASGFAQDVDPVDALVMARAQKPISGACFEAPSGPPAWRVKPSWYQLSTQDHMIPPDNQAFMAERMSPRELLSLDASHASLASQPRAVADLIIRAAADL